MSIRPGVGVRSGWEWLPKKPVFELFLSKFLIVSGGRHGFEFQAGELNQLQSAERLGRQFARPELVIDLVVVIHGQVDRVDWETSILFSKPWVMPVTGSNDQASQMITGVNHPGGTVSPGDRPDRRDESCVFRGPKHVVRHGKAPVFPTSPSGACHRCTDHRAVRS
jgi:hypothetical protein